MTCATASKSFNLGGTVLSAPGKSCNVSNVSCIQMCVFLPSYLSLLLPLTSDLCLLTLPGSKQHWSVVQLSSAVCCLLSVLVTCAAQLVRQVLRTSAIHCTLSPLIISVVRGPHCTSLNIWRLRGLLPCVLPLEKRIGILHAGKSLKPMRV